MIRDFGHMASGTLYRSGDRFEHVIPAATVDRCLRRLIFSVDPLASAASVVMLHFRIERAMPYHYGAVSAVSDLWAPNHDRNAVIPAGWAVRIGYGLGDSYFGPPVEVLSIVSGTQVDP